MTNIAEKLTYYRKKNNLTQAQLGELLHVSAQAISKWENGQAEPGLDMIVKLAEIYRVSIDELLSISPAPIANEGATAAPTPKKPNGFGKALRKFWYIPVIVLVLAAALTVTLILLNQPSKYGRMLKNGTIQIGMSTVDIKEKLGTPTDTATYEEHRQLLNGLNYNATYAIYCNERKPKNEEEVWFGVECRYLRLVFSGNDKLYEAFYNNSPTTEVWSYGDTSLLTVESYQKIKSDTGLVTFTNGSVFLGKISVTTDGRNKQLQCPLGKFNINDAIELSGSSGGTSSSKICVACGDADASCVKDDRLTGTPVYICQECRKLLFDD